MPGCAARFCKNSAAKGMRLHQFPKDPERHRQWGINAFHDVRAGFPYATLKLCQVHFTDDQFLDDGNGGRKLIQFAVPTLFENEIEMEEDAVHDNVAIEEMHHDDLPAGAGAAENADVNGNVDMDNDFMDYIDDDINTDDDLDVEIAEALRDREDEGAMWRLLENARDAIAQLKMEKKQLQRQLRREQQRIQTLEANIESFLAPDQLRRLKCPGSANPWPWSEATIKSSLQIRCMTGAKGYEYVRHQGYPLPSYRTLCRRIEGKQFMPGLDNEIISYLGMKVRLEQENARHCFLSLDEMQLRPKLEYDKGLKCYVGTISPEIARDDSEAESLATHALAFVVRGLTLHYKQAVAYLLTGASTDSAKLWDCVKKIIARLTEEGLDVRGVATDMGPNNVGMWGLNGVHAIQCQVTPCSPHPEDHNKPLYWVADIGHVQKNIRASLQNQDIILPPDVVERNNLGTNRVSLKHVSQLVSVQNEATDRGLVLAPKLTSRHLYPTQFEKMKVHFATTVLSRTTARALRFCAENDNIPEIGKEVLATAWFLEQVNDWFDMMNLRANGIDGNDKGDAIITKLQEFMELMKKLKYTKRGWKPTQTGVLLSTTSVIRLHKDLVKNGNLQYLLTSRLTTDSVENLFSQVRGVGDTHPGPVLLRHAMRLISVSQFLYIPRNSNYNEDDATYFVDFLKVVQKPAAAIHDADCNENDEVDEEELTVVQTYGLYYVAGWAALKSVPEACVVCKQVMLSEEPLAECPSDWTAFLSRGGLSHPSYAAYNAIRTAESVFNSEKRSLLKRKNVNLYLLDKIIDGIDEDTKDCMFTECHDLLLLLIKKFIALRVHVLAADRTRSLRVDVAHGGKTAYMRTMCERPRQ